MSFLPLELLERDAAPLPSHRHDDWEAESFDFANRTFRLMGMDSVTWYELPDVDTTMLACSQRVFMRQADLFPLWLILCDWRFFLKVFLANP